MKSSKREKTATGSGPQHEAKFVKGSLVRHVLVMGGTSAVGLMAVFAVDLLTIIYIVFLQDEAITAAVGFATNILLFQISLGIGFSVAASALVSRAWGARDIERARKLVMTSIYVNLGFSLLVTIVYMPFIPLSLDIVGATGDIKSHAVKYLYISFPGMPLLAQGMLGAAILRSIGDARRAMYVTLSGAIFTFILDPLLIFGLDMGIEGAAYTVLLARAGFAIMAYYGVIHVHKLVCPFSWQDIKKFAPPIFIIGVPVIVTNVATPVGYNLVTTQIAHFGEAALSGWSIVGRLVPFFFGFLFSLSGAVGPIFGQNYGARKPARMRKLLFVTMWTTVSYCFVTCLLLLLFAVPLADFFADSEESHKLLLIFARYFCWTQVFFGLLIASNSVFNTLGAPHYATILNWGRATIGTLPFAMLGGYWFDEAGVLVGWGIGGVVFGVISYFWAYRFTLKKGKLLRNAPRPLGTAAPLHRKSGQS